MEVLDIIANQLKNLDEKIHFTACNDKIVEYNMYAQNYINVVAGAATGEEVPDVESWYNENNLTPNQFADIVFGRTIMTPMKKTMDTEIADELSTKLFFEDDYVMYTTHMALKHEVFENTLTTRGQSQPVVWKFIENEFLIGRKDVDKKDPLIIMSARWHFIGQYGCSDTYWWRWAWDMLPLSKVDELNNQAADLTHRDFPSNGYREIYKALEKLTTNLAALKNGFLTFKDPTLISFLQGFLCENVPYEYLKSIEIAKDQYLLIGLYKIHWPMEIIEPVPEAPQAIIDSELPEDVKESFDLLKGIIESAKKNDDHMDIGKGTDL
jgi:hypothetical protein